MVEPMLNQPKDTPANTRLRLEQAARLQRLRNLLGLQQQDAAERAGLSRFAWARMEDGQRRIDTVALAKFCQSKDLPAEYVVSGSLSGLPSDLARDLVSAEIAEKASGGAGTVPASEPAPSGSRRRKSKASSGT